MKLLPLLACCALPLVACAPSGPSDFLASTEADTGHRILRLPFTHSWRTPDEIPPGTYKNIVVAPVTLSYLDSSNWQDSKSELVPDQATWERETRELAKRWDGYLREQFSSPVCSMYITGDRSRPKTVILETALIRNTFAKPSGEASVTFEARFSDASTGKLLGTAADTRVKPFVRDGFNPNSFANPNDDICEEWAKELMKATNRELFPVVWRH